MAVTRQKKEEVLKELIDKFGKSKSVVFADYRGLDVAGISDLRKQLREKEAEMKVAKKTLINLAAKESKVEIDPSYMEGPIAATFSYNDPLSGIQALFKFSKENDKLKLLGGVINGEVVGPDVIEKYAKLPSHQELLAKFVGSAKSPVSGFVGLLGNVLGGFVRVLSAYKDKLPAEAAPAPKAPAPVKKTEVKPVSETPATAEPEVSVEKAETPSKEEEKPE
jgi:large subunit ribosomal protein L10